MGLLPRLISCHDRYCVLGPSHSRHSVAGASPGITVYPPRGGLSHGMPQLSGYRHGCRIAGTLACMHDSALPAFAPAPIPLYFRPSSHLPVWRNW